ncbi:conserved hypothetical protein [Microsporum canis CBS 113480]|uniref:Uncharacterized protein n=1 Tax=Arthroderma otae (strain ATCC MYA-4605 / CBS 113480) TaxID=554155 RepID=C5FZE8_ARTOC|nr:conserved hypothetical protein [Microsporum canis CBS 113480]EEQ35251.1 conserved hypothetical protein [Microsporum canis CBS 113480]
MEQAGVVPSQANFTLPWAGYDPGLLNATAHQRFLHILEDSIKDLVEKRKQKEYQLAVDNFRLRANEIARREEQILQRINRPSFKPDLKPWEQFLLKGSPGSGVVLPPCPPNGYVQLMPIGGVALHLRWLRRTYMVAKNYREANPASISRKRDPRRNVNAYSNYEKNSVFNEALYPTSQVTHQNTWRRMPIPKHNRVIDRLENFNVVIERLENEDLTDYNGEQEGVRAILYRTIVEDIPCTTE